MPSISFILLSLMDDESVSNRWQLWTVQQQTRDEQGSLCQDVVRFGYRSISGVAGSWLGSFHSFPRKYHTNFYRGCTSFHKRWVSVPLSRHPCQNELIFILLTLALLDGLRWNLNVVILFCITQQLRKLNVFKACLSRLCFIVWELCLNLYSNLKWVVCMIFCF